MGEQRVEDDLEDIIDDAPADRRLAVPLQRGAHVHFEEVELPVCAGKKVKAKDFEAIREERNLSRPRPGDAEGVKDAENDASN